MALLLVLLTVALPAAPAARAATSAAPAAADPGTTWLRAAHWATLTASRITGEQPDGPTVAAMAQAVVDGASKRDLTTLLQAAGSSRQTLVREVYAGALGRSPDPGGLHYWAAWLGTAGATLVRLEARLYGSREWFVTQAKRSNRAFVALLYERLLHRHADAKGEQYWTAVLAFGLTRTTVVTAFLTTPEGRRDRTTAAYQQVLERSPDPSGLALWSAWLTRHGDLLLRATLAASPEMIARAATEPLPSGTSYAEGTGDCGAATPSTPAAFEALYSSLRSDAWVGGDGGTSLVLPNGLSVVLHGDTATGPLKPNGSLARSHGFVHNSMVLLAGGCLIPVLGPNGSATIPAPDATQWYWAGQPFLENGQIDVLVARMAQEVPNSTSVFNFKQDGTDLAQFDLVDGLPVFRDVLPTPLSAATDISWGSASATDGTYRYLYGTAADEGHLFDEDLYVARIPAAQLPTSADGWQFFDGSGWSTSPAAASPVPHTGLAVGSGITVWRQPSGTWVLVTQDGVFSDNSAVFTSQTPTGPFHAVGVPQPTSTGLDPADPTLVPYAVAAHPDWPAAPGSVLVTCYVLDTNPDDPPQVATPHYAMVNLSGWRAPGGLANGASG